MKKRHALVLSVGLVPSFAFADHVNFSASGSDADVTAAVNAFRAAIGAGGSNPNVPGSFIGGRREINWDGVPDNASTPNAFPGDFFNQNAVGRARGAQFFTAGTGFLISADNSNPTTTPTLYADINATYATEFRAFSQQRLFVANQSTNSEVRFYIPGTSDTRANSSAFGVVFCDVDLPNSTRVDYFNEQGAIINSIVVPPSAAGQGGFSFVGSVFTAGEKVWRVVITCGNRALGPNDNPGAGIDVVVMDDFIYAEPIPATNPQIFASTAEPATVLGELSEFRDALGTLNPNLPGSVGSGRREINWDGVPDTASRPNAFPGDFFNQNTAGRARGAVFSTPGTELAVSADGDNPTTTAPEFADIDASYDPLFRAFSAQRLFASLGSTICDVDFFVPGSTDAADTAGFGAIFTDVEINTSTRMEWLDRNGGLLASYHVPVGSTPNESFSFLGLKFDAPYRVASVRIQSGTTALGAGVLENIAGGVDLVVMDDFVYAEPIALSNCAVDLDNSGIVNSSDFFTFLTLFFAEAPAADFDRNGQINSNDFYVFITSFFLGC